MTERNIVKFKELEKKFNYNIRIYISFSFLPVFTQK